MEHEVLRTGSCRRTERSISLNVVQHKVYRLVNSGTEGSENKSISCS